jgi:hypothetical protein
VLCRAVQTGVQTVVQTAVQTVVQTIEQTAVQIACHLLPVVCVKHWASCELVVHFPVGAAGVVPHLLAHFR